jgi:hypothetical protein
MSDVLWAIVFGCVFTFGGLAVAFTMRRSWRGVRSLLARRFPNITDGGIRYFFHVVRMWAAFIFLSWLGWSALGHVHGEGRVVLALYVLAVALGAPAIMYWYWERSH